MVEDAITGNMLRIKDQTLHVSTATDVVDNTSVPPEWRVDDVRDLVALMLTPSPHRPNGMHSAQPTLVRAGPGTGKTWMTKQAVFTLADKLKFNAGPGIRLVPIVVYVQRIVFLIREGHAGGLLQLYIEACFAGKKMEGWRKMLIQAYEMRALIVLIDGVDEAAGLRDEIETFVHNELVPSGNRVLVTSRPEGVTTARYMGRFVIMNLNELTNEQQRRVINIQMDGSQFFDHLLSLGEVRTWLDDAYNKLKESVQGELETLYSPNLFKRKATKEEFKLLAIKEVWNEDEQQKTVKGDRVVAERSFDPDDPSQKPLSSHIALLDRQLNAFAPQRSGEPLLDRLDTVVKSLPTSVSRQEFQAAVLEDMLGPNNAIELRHRVAVELGLLLRRLRIAVGLLGPQKKKTGARAKGGEGGGKDDKAGKAKATVAEKAAEKEAEKEAARVAKVKAEAAKAAGTAADSSAESAQVENPMTQYARMIPDLNGAGAAARLWGRVMARTDELYATAERLQNTYENVMRRVAHEAGRDADEQTMLHNAVQFAELKSPVRAHEKALDEYSSRFAEGLRACPRRASPTSCAAAWPL